MKYWVVSPNLGAPGEKDLDSWCEFIRRRKVAVMGWGDDNKIGKRFKEDIAIGDLILVASGSNANKRLCITGIVAGEAEEELKEAAPTHYSYFRRLDPAIELKSDPNDIGISFTGAAHGEAHLIPAMYQLYPSSNKIDKAIVEKLLQLLGKTNSTHEHSVPNDDIGSLIEEFKCTYMDAGDGEYHRKLLLQGREEGKRNFEKVLQLQKEGKDITDAVLYGLLPYHNTSNNREKNHWIHVAPCVTKDIKEWFEGAGWAKSDEWPEIAKRLFEFIHKAVGYPDTFPSLCQDFDNKFPFKGFQVGMISPILNALVPVHYLVVNNKPVMVINWLLSSGYQARIKDMPAIIQSIKKWVQEHASLFTPMTPEGLNIYDTFDIFCHWLKGVKKHPLKQGAIQEGRYKQFGRGNPESAEKVLEKVFRDERSRNVAIQFIFECVEHAHAKNQNNWEITLGPRSVAFNVGFCRIFKFHFKELTFYLLGSAFSSELREKYADIASFDEKPFKSLDEEIGECKIAPEKIESVLSDIKYAVFEFINLAASKSKSSIRVSSHSPGVLEYIRSKLEREVPSPDYEEQLKQGFAEGDGEGYEDESPEGIITEVKEDGAFHDFKNEEYTIEDCAEKTGFSNEKLIYWKGAIDRKKQAVFFGPPGTGKTWIAHHIARHMIGGTDGIMDCIQFHPAYTYEEFMQGIRPDINNQKNLQFELKPGRFLEFCEKAEKRSGPCVLIIDEINRANLARVFGELMYLLEYREKEIPLAGGSRFHIPDNVRIIGTMNTADRSIALVDFALRRRFAFLELQPEYGLLHDFQAKRGFQADGLVNMLKCINEKIGDKNFHLGISFFMIDDFANNIEEIWRMEIETYLEEYFYSQPKAMDELRWDSIAGKILL
jgi:hypothetical protein